MSTEFVIWVAIGGRATLLGPIVGAIIINYAKTSFSESMPEYWWYFYGFLFIAATIIVPKGIVGSLIEKKWFQKIINKAQNE